MRYHLAIYIFIIVLLSCKNDGSEIEVEQNIFQKSGIEDYESYIRHPISQGQELDSTEMPKIDFENTVFNFDTIYEGEKVAKVFQFKNTGSKPLYILDTRVSCGCTVADYEKEEILPGKEGTLTVNFDSSGKFGYQYKNLIIITNSIPNESTINVQGYIKQKKK